MEFLAGSITQKYKAKINYHLTYFPLISHNCIMELHKTARDQELIWVKEKQPKAFISVVQAFQTLKEMWKTQSNLLIS